MVGVKGRSGGKRRGAGRPRKGAAKAPPPPKRISKVHTPVSTVSGKPVLVSAQSREDKAKARLGFKDYAKKPGVTILDKTAYVATPIRLIPRGKEWMLEAGPVFRAAKATYQPYQQTDPTTESYAGMHKFYKEYRRDDLVRSCIDAIAYYSTCKRFETVLEPTQHMDEKEAKAFVEQYKYVKDEIDRINKQVDLDNIAYIAITNASIDGFSLFEKIWLRGRVKSHRNLFSLLPLESTLVRGATAANGPNLDEDWNVTGYPYNYADNYYTPEEVLYFPNMALKADRIGLSDIEPIIDSVQARRAILEEAIPEATTVLWAGIGYVSVNTEGLTDTEAENLITDLQTEFKPGKWVFGNHKIEVTIADLKPNLIQLNMTLDKLEQIIIGNFKVPPFIVGRERQVNRATAYAELEAFMNGPIAKKQQGLSRQLEAQWYTPLVREILATPEGEESPVEIKHVWNKYSTADFTELLNALSQAEWMPNEKKWELAGFDPKEYIELTMKRQKQLMLPEKIPPDQKQEEEDVRPAS